MKGHTNNGFANETGPIRLSSSSPNGSPCSTTAHILPSPYLASADPRCLLTATTPEGNWQTMPLPIRNIATLTHGIEKLSREDPAAAVVACAVAVDPLFRQACNRARVSSSFGQSGVTVTVSAGYYAFAATTLNVRGLLPLVEAMVRGVLYGYLGWSTDDATLMRLRVPDERLCDAILSRIRAPDCDGSRVSPVLECAGITPDTARMRDLTSWLVSPTQRLTGPGAATLFGGRLAQATGPTLARERDTVRVGDLALGTFAAPPELATAHNSIVHLVRSIHPRDILRLIGWPDDEPAPADVVSLIPSGDAAFWDRLRLLVDSAIVPYMPGGEGVLAGCSSLARSGLIPRLSQLFPLDFCIVSSHGMPCLFVAARPMNQTMWKDAFEAVGHECPFSASETDAPGRLL